MMIKVPVVGLLGVLLLSVVGCSSSSGTSTGQTYTIRYVVVSATDSPTTQGQLKFKAEVERQSKGRIMVDAYSGNQYANGNLTDIQSQAKLGVIQMADLAPAGLSQLDPNWGVLALPFLFTDDAKAMTALDGKGGQMLATSLYNSGSFKLLGWQDQGARNLAMAKQPVHTLADLKGKKIRVISSDTTLAVYTALGANPVGMNSSEVPSALSAGVIDGYDQPIVPFTAFQGYANAPYYTLTGTSFEVVATIMNRQFWDSLPTDLQAIVATAEKNATVYQRAANIALESTDLAVLKSKGVTVIALDTAEQAKFRNAVAPVTSAWKTKYGPFILEALQSGS
jgi:tripartite ATP-independent transporter DctP family solute receptor